MAHPVDDVLAGLYPWILELGSTIKARDERILTSVMRKDTSKESALRSMCVVAQGEHVRRRLNDLRAAIVTMQAVVGKQRDALEPKKTKKIARRDNAVIVLVEHDEGDVNIVN
jgi:hypothetical protein